MKPKIYLFSLFLMFYAVLPANSQNLSDSLPVFNITQYIKTTPVKNQYKTNTCWSYSVLAMIESEFIKDGKGTINLSEMYIVYQTYLHKAEHYLRMQGKTNFSGGGSLSDPLEIISKHGIVPLDVYTGLKNGSVNPDHFKMDRVLRNYVDSIILKKNINSNWRDGFTSILDNYMGKIPDTFVFNEKQYTPVSFAKDYKIDPNDYIMLSSFVYKPYYCKFFVEVPDNWSLGTAFNIPMEELVETIDNSLKSGYTVAIAVDISEDGFQWDKGLANFQYKNKDGKFDPQERQKAFDLYETTDDHGVLITGIASDRDGKKFYLVKNSWGTQGTAYSGFIYMSEDYLMNKLITVMVNKNHMLDAVKKKLDPCCIQ